MLTFTILFNRQLKRVWKQQTFLTLIWNKIKPFLTWRILLCYLPFWFIASGWAWVGSVIGYGMFRYISITWLGILWLPCCPEKIITIPCAIWLHKKLFPNHSTAVLDEVLKKEKNK